MSLTTQEKQFYEDNGYLLRKGLVPRSWIADVEREIDRIHERMAEQPAAGVGISWEEFDDPEHPPRIKQLMHSEVISPTLNRILRCAAMLDILEDLMGTSRCFTASCCPKRAATAPRYRGIRTMRTGKGTTIARR